MPNWKTYESSVRLLSAILAAHPDLKLNYAEIAKAFGGDCTKWAIDNRFRSLKTDAKRIGDALASGLDPISLDIPSGAKGRNPSIADNAAQKAPRTPKKKAVKKNVSDEDNEDEEEPEISPSKFTPKESLNKTKGGRVSKARTPRKAAAAIPTYVESDAEEDEDDDDNADEYTEEKVSSIVVKSESNEYGAVTPNHGQESQNFAAGDHAGNSFGHHSFSSGFANGNSNGHSNGHSNGQLGGYDMEDEDEFHEARNNQFGIGYDDDAV
ncbi:hypothetical protein VE01_06093 [Pseudogymnoascus verrucosus]|uniref:Uncharacterized protein n=1 Tax=Pseudogymnoascus verrucosus TaxID=342668 RepID=A0A1B8GJB6_9PEZI|nr:uncharacterized protein VE01_06093 [Pseudogymnoascus verrucosus]OBT95909.2 hypothetical protein VE01_06093 [Pseudogymnoascus verrucosus]